MATPRDAGFFMPPEWAPHARTWMAWPCREAWWGTGIDEARRAYAELSQVIARFEPVTMLARPADTAQASLYCGPGISILPMPLDDSWTRDTGPTFLIDGKGGLAGISWRFNGWGGISPDHVQDAQLAGRILEHAGAARFTSSLVTEGGAIHVDGEGTALVCTPSLLDPRRNPGLGMAEVEAELMGQLGVERVIWLPRGLKDDETAGHIDNLACFARPGVVLALMSEDKADENYSTLAENQDVLRAARDARGRALEVVPVPQPKAKARHDGTRLTLSHLNFYLANGVVIVPSFGGATDQPAARAIAGAFPGRQLVQVEATAIVEGGGGIHCVTQQQPQA